MKRLIIAIAAALAASGCINVDATLRAIIGNMADEEDMNRALQAIRAWVDPLKRAGAKDVYCLVDPTDFPGLPILVVPLVVVGHKHMVTTVV